MKKLVTDLDVKGKKVLVRVDFNVPLDKGNITSALRIERAMPTINYLLENGAKVILCSHLGRPKGKVDKKYSLKPVANYLKNELGIKVKFAKDVAGEDSVKKVNSLKPGQVVLLENLRFESGEKKNSDVFAKKLAKLADVYVNDAFGTSHREHASMHGVAKLLPNAIGFLVEKELEIINGNLENPARPFVAILGGAKVADKISVIENLLEKVDSLVIGGGMAYTFIKALGGEIGDSLLDETKLDFAKNVIKTAEEKKVNIYLPVDNIVADKIEAGVKTKVSNSYEIPAGLEGLDIGPKTVKKFKKAIKGAGTVIWNGTMGVCELDEFASGTRKLAKALAKSKTVSIIGGGDTAAAIEKMGFADKMTHISTGGGASLMLLEGKELPAVSIIKNK